ncbi:hypothetical protein ABNF97_14920 [Plantactinospora sp. B6F1]|uniref:hypothetical protein n=1 Tax=Plantactinospora sp. B6F1 TaxID=3158971 RepID=UPI00102BDD12
MALTAAKPLLTAYGPALLAENPAGRALLFLLWLAGLVLVLFTQVWYARAVVFFGAGFLLLAALLTSSEAIEPRLLEHRGAVTVCTVLDVRSKWVSDTASGYVYRLSCVDSRVTEMTTYRWAGDPDDRITVLYDTAHRLGPRPVPVAGIPIGIPIALLGAGIALRLLYDFGVPPFGYRAGAGGMVARALRSGGPVRRLGARAATWWLCWRFESDLGRAARRVRSRNRRRQSRRRALDVRARRRSDSLLDADDRLEPRNADPFRRIWTVAAVLSWSSDTWSVRRAARALEPTPTDYRVLRNLLDCFVHTLPAGMSTSPAGWLTPAAVSFLLTPLSNPASTPHVPAVRLVGLLSPTTRHFRGPVAGFHRDVARWLVDAAPLIEDATARDAVAELLSSTNQPDLLDALEVAFTDRVQVGGRLPGHHGPGGAEGLWRDGEPTLLVRIVLANPQLPVPPIEGSGDYHYDARVLIAVLKDRLDVVQEWVRCRGHDPTVDVLRTGTRLPAPTDFRERCERALRITAERAT